MAAAGMDQGDETGHLRLTTLFSPVVVDVVNLHRAEVGRDRHRPVQVVLPRAEGAGMPPARGRTGPRPNPRQHRQTDRQQHDGYDQPASRHLGIPTFGHQSMRISSHSDGQDVRDGAHRGTRTR